MLGYISKDFIHRGCGLILEPQKVWELVPYSVQKNIKKAESSGIKVEKVIGSIADIDILKSMWYDPEDPNMPNCLSSKEFMFIAYLDDKPIGVVILLPVGNHLFLNNLAGNEEGKALRVQDYLLWHCVNFFQNSEFKYIDVGVSYRQTLYDFFKKWQVISYPVIFNIPEIKFHIALEPFTENHYNSVIDNQNIKNTEESLKAILKGRKFTFIPNLEECQKILERLGCEYVEHTYNFTDESLVTPFAVDLTKIFSVQFGALLVNLDVDDKSLWNQHRAWDPFKREFVFSNICDETAELDVVIARRKQNIVLLDEYFSLEGIKSIKKNEIIPSAYYFKYELNERYHNKLNDFGIKHFYDAETGEIGIPIHQNLTNFHIEYLYAIFRGVLNLCSEWVHTDYYNDLK